MYARVLRKWSLKTNLMSYLWLLVVTMLLLIICAPTTTTTMATMAPTAAALTSRLRTATVLASTPAETSKAKQLQLAPSSRSLWQELAVPSVAPATTALESASVFAKIPATNVGVAEESFYIPVATEPEYVGLLRPRAWQQQQQKQQQPQQQESYSSVHSRLLNISPISSSSNSSSSSSSSSTSSSSTSGSSNSISRNSKSKILSNSNRLSNSFQKQQQQQQQQQRVQQSAPKSADSLMYSYYFNSAARSVSNVPQLLAAVNDVAISDINVHVKDYNIDDDEPIEHTTVASDVSSPAAARLTNLYTADTSNQVPNVPNSQIINFYNKLTHTQAQLPAVAANVRNSKTRRHVVQQQQQQQLPSYHSPVRETVTNAAVAAAGTGVPSSNSMSNNNSKSFVPPFRYIIEAFEIPATLPYTTLTQQQQRMLLHQQQLAARNRRDSRAFGLNVGNSDYQQHYYNSQQQQPYQRLQQHHNQPNINDNTFQKYHQTNTNTNNNNQHHNHHQQQHQHQHHHHHNRFHQHQRNRRRRYCSARDPAQLAFEAPTVFEGKIISMTPDRRANFSATVEVKEVFKQQIGFRLQKYLRLQFAYRNTSGECDIYREQLRARGLVRGDELEQGRIYLLFVQQIDLSNFTILGQPIRKTRRVIEAVKNAVSENYAQLAAIRSITASNRTVENGKELRIVCKVQGRPPPKVTWFKDHKSINRNRRLYQIVPFKKRSELIIRSFNSSDAGRYECRAKNKVNRNLERRAIVIKAYPVPRYETHLTGGTGHTCPPDAAEFCFNGGTCKLFVEIGSYSCICPEGFIGERCDRKEVNNMPPSTYSNEQECGEKKYLGSYYC